MTEVVTSSEGPKNPGAACNQLSGLLHGLLKKQKKYEVEGWSPARLRTQC